MAVNVIDRRLNPSGKSLPNRQRFMRLARSSIKDAVVRSIRERAIGDVDSKEVVSIPMKRIAEPRLRHASEGGDRDQVLPGNREFVRGDTLPKSKSGAGGAGSTAAADGDGEDAFSFTLTSDEYLDMLFEELELPDLAKMKLKETLVARHRRAGHSTSGAPTNLNLVRTMRHSLARRISLGRPDPEALKVLDAEIAALEAIEQPDRDVAARLDALRADRGVLLARLRRVAYIDPVDLRYNRFEPRPEPTAQAVMFCLMDVSGSMTEDIKDLAKRFFLLLHLFLTRQYSKVDVVFIRHTSEAREVDEETFFKSRETGGTVVSTALVEMKRVIEDRYAIEDWNIYAAQASDGDNISSDSARCRQLLTDDILPICQYFAYVEVNSAPSRGLAGPGASGLWKDYQAAAGQRANFAMRRVSNKSDVFPVFRELFSKPRTAA
jgi:uncharacterized sporulation protein YeaH/YhbH (DUF444 family)